jgi:16S rRNA (adenine1518-N6/adenine1519-N6)-dimethyltransferase
VNSSKHFGVKAKKHLGQHFLKNTNAANQTALAASDTGCKNILEIGPGTGVLTLPLLNHFTNPLLCELDLESVHFLQADARFASCRILSADVLSLDFSTLFAGQAFCVVGNFPYNISSQIVFKIIENRALVHAMVGMFQKEVAERICSKPGSKVYGVISVLTQAFYATELLFTLPPEDFEPAPEVHSAVIRLRLKPEPHPLASSPLFSKLVKTAFSQRRKKLRNALSVFSLPDSHPFAGKRAEELSVDDFLELLAFLMPNLETK